MLKLRWLFITYLWEVVAAQMWLISIWSCKRDRGNVYFYYWSTAVGAPVRHCRSQRPIVPVRNGFEPQNAEHADVNLNARKFHAAVRCFCRSCVHREKRQTAALSSAEGNCTKTRSVAQLGRDPVEWSYRSYVLPAPLKRSRLAKHGTALLKDVSVSSDTTRFDRQPGVVALRSALQQSSQRTILLPTTTTTTTTTNTNIWFISPVWQPHQSIKYNNTIILLKLSLQMAPKKKAIGWRCQSAIPNRRNLASSVPMLNLTIGGLAVSSWFVLMPGAWTIWLACSFSTI